MPSYALIHPIIGAITIIALLIATASRLILDDADTLHYISGIMALIGVIISVILAFSAVIRLTGEGIQPPGILIIHMIVGLIILLAVIAQSVMGILMWQGGEDRKLQFLPIHGLVGPALAVLMLIQGGLGFVTLLGFLT